MSTDLQGSSLFGNLLFGVVLSNSSKVLEKLKVSIFMRGGILLEQLERTLLIYTDGNHKNSSEISKEFVRTPPTSQNLLFKKS
jgi:hypothetical protein